jgi:hypothetical protein
MNKRTYYRALFFIDAIKAWLLAIQALLMDNSAILNDTGLMFYNSFMVCVIIVGLGYFIVGLDIDKNHGLVVTSIVAQFSVFTLFTYYFAIGVAIQLQLIAGIMDLVFAVLMVEFLLHYKKLSPK